MPLITYIWNRAISFVQNFDAANAKRSSLVIGNSKSRAAHWVPPDPSVFKLNVDAICDKSSGKVGLGIVVRNEGDRNFAHLLVESDYLDVINLYNDSGIILSDIGNIVSNVRIALGCFNVVSISHVLRLNNFVAHGIVR
ncbi:hypothetical protein ACOSQ2_030906 [Xanthoceras sorbifolium]